MALRPRNRHIHDSWADHFREDMASQEYSSKRSIPHPLARALVRGLLVYYSIPARRRKADQQAMDWQEYGLMELINRIAAEDTWTPDKSYNNELVNRFSSRITKELENLLRHPHPLALAPESDWLCEQLTSYGKLESGRRIPWLKRELPKLLRGLNERSRCGRLSCPRRTTIPDIHGLEKWALPHSTIGTIRLHVLAHFHGSTFETVRRALSSSSS
jgi:hypothetical protein